MFTGFSQDAIDFLSEIRLNNHQQFYEANRARYEESVKAPLRALCDEMSEVVAMIDPGLDTRPGRTMSRIRRDTRFTKDKSPFRDHVWMGWRYPGESRSEGFGLEHSGTQADWAALRTHEMADLLAADLLALGPLHQLMRRMRAQAESAQEETVRRQEEERRARTAQEKPVGRLTVRSAEEFEF